MPEIEADRAVILTDSYKKTEGLPIIERRAQAFCDICEKLPIIIRDDELIVGSNTKSLEKLSGFPGVFISVAFGRALIRLSTEAPIRFMFRRKIRRL